LSNWSSLTLIHVDCGGLMDSICQGAANIFSANITLHQVVRMDGGALSLQKKNFPSIHAPNAPQCHFLLDLGGRLSCLVKHDSPPARWDQARLLRAKKRLLHIKRAISDALAGSADAQWMEKYFSHLQGLGQQAEAALAKAETAPIIGVVGASRLGKSALINVLLQCNLMPAEAGEVTTAVATSVSYADSDSFRCTFDLESPDSIRRMLEQYKQCLGLLTALNKRKDAGGADDDQDGEEDQVRPADMNSEVEKIKNEMDQHKGRLSALMGAPLLDSLVSRKPSNDASAKWRLVLKTAEDKQRTILEVQDITILGELVKPFLSAVETNQNKDEIPLWPLVRHAHICGRFPLLASGSVLLDLPGVSDKNAARRELAAKYLTECSHVLLLGNTINPQDPSFSDILKTIGDVNRSLLRHLTVVVPQCISKLNLSELRSIWNKHTSKDIKGISLADKCRMHIVTRVGKFEEVLGTAGIPECIDAPVVAIDAFSAAYIEGVFEQVVGAAHAEDLESLVSRLDNPRECQVEGLRRFLQQSATNRHWYLMDLETQLDQLFQHAAELAKSGPSTFVDRNEHTLAILQRFKDDVVKQQAESFPQVAGLLKEFSSKAESSAGSAPAQTVAFFANLRRVLAWNTFLAHATRNGEFYDNWNRVLLEHFSSATGSASTDAVRSHAVTALFQIMSSFIQRFEEDARLAGAPPPVVVSAVGSLERQRELCRDSIYPATSNARLMEILRSFAIPGYYQICGVYAGRGRFDRMVQASMSLSTIHRQLLHSVQTEVSEIHHSCQNILQAFGSFVIAAFERLFDEVSVELRSLFISSAVTTRFAAEIARNSEDYALDQDLEDILGRLAQVHVQQNLASDNDAAGDMLGVPYRLSCPISLQLMVWPIRANDGHVYDASSLLDMINAGGPLRSPLNQDLILDPSQFELDAVLSTDISKWLESDRGRVFLRTDEGMEFSDRKAELPESPF
jgi:hypothetical protein